ncbi:MAG TPA: (2Fe-2S)-binding protein [Alphaproteobacteria bacterium]|nr:(2Fe-2S)-binding protein [Alphaproteobacteria bacterium]HBF98848.1 (2Fe-2S)-binding protein [Alphaproteobacteria bacterium]HCO91655.1 (2Fe-2S)-binding protein [Alphaproteobacteria bacterium]
MYICLCNRHRDGDLKELAQQGIRCVRAAYQALGGEPQCGRCLSFAQALIDAIPAEAEALLTPANAPLPVSE